MEVDYAAVVEQQYDLLARTIDPNSRFLKKLTLVGIITKDNSDILTRQSVGDRVDSLLEILASDEISREKKEKLLATLRSSKQEHVANVFNKRSVHTPMSDCHFLALKNNLDKLSEICDCESGIVDKLFSKNVLVDFEREKIAAIAGFSAKAATLIETLLRKPDSAFNILLDVLQETGQEHITRLLKSAAGDSDSEPADKLPMSETNCLTLRNAAMKIREILDPECGVVERLSVEGVFITSDLERIRHCGTYSEKSQEIVNTLLRKSDAGFHKFIQALFDSEQDHVVYVINGTGSPPIREEFIQNMTKNRPSIIESINPKTSGLLDVLVGCRVIGDYDRIDPSTKERELTTETNMNIEIMRLIPRRSQAAFDKFIVALVATQQSHVAKLFVGEELAGKLVIEFKNGVDEVTKKSVEHKLKIKLSEILFDGIQLKNDLIRILTANDIVVSYVKDGCIAIGFRCLSVTAIEKFREMYTSRELDRLLTNQYLPTFEKDGVKSIGVSINDDEFERCTNVFQLSTPMSAVHREALISAAKSPEVVNKLLIDDNLLEELSLCDRRKQAIRETPSHKRASVLLRIVSWQPDTAFTTFIDALQKGGQNVIAEYLTKPIPKSLTCENSTIADGDENNVCFIEEANERAATSALLAAELQTHEAETARTPPNVQNLQTLQTQIESMAAKEKSLKARLKKAEKRDNKTIEKLESECVQMRKEIAAWKEKEKSWKRNEKKLNIQLEKSSEAQRKLEEDKSRYMWQSAQTVQVVSVAMQQLQASSHGLPIRPVLQQFQLQPLQMNIQISQNLSNPVSVTTSPVMLSGPDAQPRGATDRRGRTTSGDAAVRKSTTQSHITKLPIEMLEKVLLKVCKMMFAVNSQGLRHILLFVDPGIPLFDKRRMLESQIEAIQGSIFYGLAQVCQRWWHTLGGWPESSTRKWFKHKLRQTFIHYRREMVSLGVDLVKVSLLDLIEPDYGLLEELLSAGVIDRRVYTHLQNEPTVFRRNNAIIQQLAGNSGQLSEQTYRNFLKALQDADQQHVANYIINSGVIPEDCGDVRPLDDDYMNLLDHHRRYLVDMIHPSDSLLARLLQYGCINRQQEGAIRSVQGDDSNKTRKLLDILSRRSVANFNKFIDCLALDHQQEVADKIRYSQIIGNRKSSKDRKST